MRFFGEVDEGFGGLCGLDSFEVGDDLLDERERGEEADFEFFVVGDTIFLRGNETVGY